MRPLLLIFLLFNCLLFFGCATAPEVKQAVVSMDKGYDENLKMIEQYHQLVKNINTRYKLWYYYVQERAYLNRALKWSTTDPAPSTAKVALKHLGEDVVKYINENRLDGLMAVPEEFQIFSGGTKKIEDLIQGLPKLINKIQKKVKDDYKKQSPINYAGFEDYRKNVVALKEINAVIKRYLEIDVSVKGDDVREIADSIKKLTE